jgi:hypothetical protein
MPTLFIPGYSRDAAEEAYQAQRQRLRDHQFSVSEKRLWRLEYIHDDIRYVAEVGSPHALTGEDVLAIFQNQSDRSYYICTRNRGWLGSEDVPILTGREGGDTILSVVAFDG